VILILRKTEWQGLPVDLAVPVGEKVPPRALQWLKAYAERHRRPLLYGEQVVDAHGYTGEQIVFGYGPPAFQVWASEQGKTRRGLW